MVLMCESWMTQVGYGTNGEVWATGGLLPTLGCAWACVTALAQRCSDCNATASSQQEMVTGIYYPVCPCNWYPGQSSTALRLHSMCPTVLRADRPISSNVFRRQLLYSSHGHFQLMASLISISVAMACSPKLILSYVGWRGRRRCSGGWEADGITLSHSTPLLPPGWQSLGGSTLREITSEACHDYILKCSKEDCVCSMFIQ